MAKRKMTMGNKKKPVEGRCFQRMLAYLVAFCSFTSASFVPITPIPVDPVCAGERRQAIARLVSDGDDEANLQLDIDAYDISRASHSLQFLDILLADLYIELSVRSRAGVTCRGGFHLDEKSCLAAGGV